MKNLFFYRGDGTAAVGHIADGQFVQTQSLSGLTTNWSDIDAVKDYFL